MNQIRQRLESAYVKTIAQARECGAIETEPEPVIENPGLHALEQIAYRLFSRICEQHGIMHARRIFLKFGRPPTAKRLNRFKNLALLDRYDMMKPKPNINRLARELVEENKRLPLAERHGPRGSTNEASMRAQIKFMVDKRKAAMEKGDWHGPWPV